MKSKETKRAKMPETAREAAKPLARLEPEHGKQLRQLSATVAEAEVLASRLMRDAQVASAAVEMAREYRAAWARQLLRDRYQVEAENFRIDESDLVWAEEPQ